MRKSISTAFFSMVSTLMVLGIVLMGCSEWVLFKNYFAKDRYETLDQVVNVAKRTAEYLVNSETMPQGAELDALNTKLEIIGESAEAYLFFTDRQGNVLIASDPDKLTTTTVPLDICQRANAVADPDARHYHAFGDLGGALTEKSYIAAVETIDDQSLLSGLAEGQLDMAVLSGFGVELGKELDSRVTLSDPCMVMISASHPLAAKKEIHPRELKGMPIVLNRAQDSQPSAGLIAGMYANMGLRENKRMYADDFYSIALIINTGIAFSIMPASVACWGIDGVVFRPVQGFKAKARTLLVYPRGSQDTGIRSFVSLIKPKR